jgi:hypothetical protein
MIGSSALRALPRLLAPALVLASSLAAVALAAGPVKGASYSGALVHGKQQITLKVSKDGKSVTVRVAFPPLYCEGGGAGTKQLTKPAPISKSGSFSATIVYEFTPTHSRPSRLVIKGKFSGRKVSGSARSEFLKASSCDGSTSFSAKSK